MSQQLLFEWDYSINEWVVGALPCALPSLCKVFGFVKLYVIWGQDLFWQMGLK